MSGTAIKPLRIAVLASGRGSNLQALVDAGESGRMDGKVALVVSDNPGAYALERAKKNGIPSRVIERKNFASRRDFDSAFADAVEESGVDIVALAGFMRIISPSFLHQLPGKVINIHPSLLPAFPGLDAQKQALEYGVKITGCTVHFVDEGVDTGPIIIQSAVPVLPDDTVELLSARILQQEHIIYPKAVTMIARGEARPPEGYLSRMKGLGL